MSSGESTDGAQSSAAPGKDRVQRGGVAVWRRQMLERVLWVVWIAISIAVALQLREAYSGGHWERLPTMTLGWVLGGLAALGRRADLRLRGAGLFASMIIACIGSLLYAAFYGPNAFLGIMMVVLLLAVGFGPRAAWWALGASTLALTGVAALFVSAVKGLPDLDPALVDVHAAGNWARVILTFTAVTAGTLFCVSYVTTRLESALLRDQALLDALASESQQRLEALERQRTLFQQLQHAQKLESIGTLVGGVAHDFNNLLLVILSHADLMQRRKVRDPSDFEVSVRAIEDAARRATELTRQLLAYNHRQVPGQTRFELAGAVERALGLIGRLLPASIELKFTPGKAPLTMWGVQVELDQVVMNLCVNARDAMPNGGTLDITTALVTRKNSADNEAPPRSAGAVPLVDTAYACIAVRDTGTGMSPEHQARIFEAFFTTKPPDRGTGLGLSVVHDIVAQWGGFIEVDSAEGRGTEMRVYVPFSDEPAQGASSDTAPIGTLRGRETVLLVDDDPRVRSVTETILCDAGYRVITCANGVEALARFREAPAEIDLIITDAIMPRMGGRELFDAISLDHPDLPCLICSGYAPDAVTADFFVPGQREFLQKPFSADVLLVRARHMLDVAAQRPQAQIIAGRGRG